MKSNEFGVSIHSTFFEQQIERNYNRIAALFGQSSTPLISDQTAIIPIKLNLLTIEVNTFIKQCCLIMNFLFKQTLLEEYQTITDSNFQQKSSNLFKLLKFHDYVSLLIFTQVLIDEY